MRSNIKELRVQRETNMGIDYYTIEIKYKTKQQSNYKETETTNKIMETIT